MMDLTIGRKGMVKNIANLNSELLISLNQLSLNGVA